MTAVSDLLAASLSAHQRSLPVKGRPRDMVALQQASDLRADALALDPDMTDPAWGQSKASHRELTTFYAAQLARTPEDIERVALRQRST